MKLMGISRREALLGFQERKRGRNAEAFLYGMASIVFLGEGPEHGTRSATPFYSGSILWIKCPPLSFTLV